MAVICRVSIERFEEERFVETAKSISTTTSTTNWRSLIDGRTTHPLKALLQPYCEVAIAVRMLVVNGMLHFQVGRFDKGYSSRVLRPGSLAVYETFTTIASFPLMYFSYQHGIPVRTYNHKQIETLAKAFEEKRQKLLVTFDSANGRHQPDPG